MNKHTPGPWIADEDGWIKGGDGYVIEYAGCGSHEAYWNKQEDKALALAAPDLLEALECVEQETMLLARMKNCELRRGKGSFGIAVMGDELALEWQEYNKIRRALEDKRFAVIAKARGEA